MLVSTDDHSWRRPWTLMAPSMVSARPVAARGVSTFAVPVIHGTNSPTAPINSRAAIVRIWVWVKPVAHCHLSSFSSSGRGVRSLVVPAAVKTSPTRAESIQVAMFNLCDLPVVRVISVPRWVAVRAADRQSGTDGVEVAVLRGAVTEVGGGGSPRTPTNCDLRPGGGDGVE